VTDHFSWFHRLLNLSKGFISASRAPTLHHPNPFFHESFVHRLLLTMGQKKSAPQDEEKGKIAKGRYSYGIAASESFF